MNPLQKELAAQALANNVTDVGLAQVTGIRVAGDKANMHRRVAATKNDPEVQERAVEIVRTRFAANGITADRVMTEIARVAFSNAKDLFRPDGTLKDIHEMDDDTAATIISVEVEDKAEVEPPKRKIDKRFAGWEETDTSDPDFQPTVKPYRILKLKRADKMAALGLFAKHFKIVGNEDGGIDALAGALADRLNAANRRAMQRQPLATVDDARIIDPDAQPTDPFGLVQTAPTQSTPPAAVPQVIDTSDAAPAAPATAPSTGAPHEDDEDVPLW